MAHTAPRRTGVCARPIHVLLCGGPLDGASIGESEAGWRDGSCGFNRLTAAGVVIAYSKGSGPFRYFTGYHLVHYG
jgi:hypothetical protein